MQDYRYCLGGWTSLNSRIRNDEFAIYWSSYPQIGCQRKKSFNLALFANSFVCLVSNYQEQFEKEAAGLIETKEYAVYLSCAMAIVFQGAGYSSEMKLTNSDLAKRGKEFAGLNTFQ